MYRDDAWGTYTYEVIKERQGHLTVAGRKIKDSGMRSEKDIPGSFCKIVSPGKSIKLESEILVILNTQSLESGDLIGYR